MTSFHNIENVTIVPRYCIACHCDRNQRVEDEGTVKRFTAPPTPASLVRYTCTVCGCATTECRQEAS